MTEDQAPGTEFDGLLPCGECDALNPPTAAFCGECGVKIVQPRTKAGGAPPPLPAQPRRRRSAGDAVEKSRQRQEFARIKNIVPTVRFVFAASAIFAFVQVLMWHTLFAALANQMFSGWYLVVTVLVYGQLALTVAGALLVLRAPLVWTAIGASYWTLNTALGWFVCVQTPIGLTTIYVGLQTVMLLAFWFATAQAARVQRLMAANPELQIIRRRFDPNRRVEGGVADHVRSQRRRESQLVWGQRFKVIAIATAGLVVVGLVIWQLTGPPAPDAAIARFARQWQGGEVEKITQQIIDGRHSSRLSRDLARRGWSSQGPRLGEPEVERSGDRVNVTWRVAGGEVVASFQLDETWQLVDVDLPRMQPTPIGPVIEAFERAWESEGTGALLEMFRPESRERIGGAMVKILQRRDWHRRRPAIGDFDAGSERGGRCRVLFALGFDELSVTFEYWHSGWHVVALTPPRR